MFLSFLIIFKPHNPPLYSGKSNFSEDSQQHFNFCIQNVLCLQTGYYRHHPTEKNEDKPQDSSLEKATRKINHLFCYFFHETVCTSVLLAYPRKFIETLRVVIVLQDWLFRKGDLKQPTGIFFQYQYRQSFHV